MRHGGEHSVPLRLALRTADERRQLAAARFGRPTVVVAVTIVAACAVILVVLGPASVAVRALLVAIAAAAALAVVWAMRRSASARAHDHASPEVIVDDLGVSVAKGATGEAHRLITLRPTFGVSVLASAARDKVVLAVTAPGRVLCVGADVPRSGPARARMMGLIPAASTVPGDDLVMSTVLPDGTVLVMSAERWLQLLDALVAIEPMALERCFLSDTQGGQVWWNGEWLRTPRCTFRLDQAFEWKAWAFQESQGMGAAFQATSVRQGKDEVVFVSLLGADVRVSIHDAAQAGLRDVDAVLQRDARLCDAPLAPAPPQDRRIAIDRLFMLPLRRVLDRKHHISRPSVPGDASVP